VIRRLPNLHAKEVVRAFEREGFIFQWQKGSHMTLRHLITKRTIVIAIHSGEFPRQYLKSLLKQSGITEGNLSNWYEKKILKRRKVGLQYYLNLIKRFFLFHSNDVGESL
jgi:predicted RNA binding protein YcfA (HicA-like mRNA interferase family)